MEREVVVWYKDYTDVENLINKLEETGKLPKPVMVRTTAGITTLDIKKKGLVSRQNINLTSLEYEKLPKDFFDVLGEDRPKIVNDYPERPMPKAEVGQRIRIYGSSRHQTIASIIWTTDDAAYRYQEPPHYHYRFVEDPSRVLDENELISFESQAIPTDGILTESDLVQAAETAVFNTRHLVSRTDFVIPPNRA